MILISLLIVMQRLILQCSRMLIRSESHLALDIFSLVYSFESVTFFNHLLNQVNFISTMASFYFLELLLLLNVSLVVLFFDVLFVLGETFVKMFSSLLNFFVLWINLLLSLVPLILNRSKSCFDKMLFFVILLNIE